MATLQADFTLPLRAFALELALDVSRTVALVGPSGAGKTSVLRVVAGLAAPRRGRVSLDGERWLDTERRLSLPPERRRVGLVFQDYALFPHLSVRGNIAFGAGPARTFFRVILTLSRRGLAAGESLSFARGLGEFGATIMFAGSLQGVTQTLPLAIYQEFARNFTTALAMSALLVVVSGALLVALRVTLQWQPSKPTSRFLFAPSR